MNVKDEMLLRSGPTNFDEANYIRNAFLSATSRAIQSTELSELLRWLAEADRWRFWLPACLVAFKAEVRRREREPISFLIRDGEIIPYVKDAE